MTPELALIGVLWAWVLGRMATLGPRLDSLHWMPCISASHWYRINAVPAQTPYRYITWGIVLHILCCFIMIAHTSRITYMVACVHACLCVAWVPLFFERALGFQALAGLLVVAQALAVLSGPLAIPAIVLATPPTVMTVQLARKNPIIVDEIPYIPRVPREP